MENRVNILVLGIDESLERSSWGSFRTDTMIFMSIDFETSNVYMISFAARQLRLDIWQRLTQP